MIHFQRRVKNVVIADRLGRQGFFTTSLILKLKQLYYKQVLEKDRNYNKVHRPDKHNKNIEDVGDGELTGGGRRGVGDAYTRMEDRAALWLKEDQRSRRNAHRTTERLRYRRRRR